MTEDLKDCIARHNKNGAADKIDFAGYAVFEAHLPVAMEHVNEPAKLDDFVRSMVDASTNYAREIAKTEMLGYEVLVGKNEERVYLRIYTGRQYTTDERFVNDALAQISDKELADYDTAMKKVREIIPEEAFDRFRAILSKGGVTREIWNVAKKPKPYTGPADLPGVILKG